ncbi:hypothetical protein [Isorropodon fossajaponicum symbiont]|nr:hypothetical protein [Isorropodon fossajaponicum symbiont]
MGYTLIKDLHLFLKDSAHVLVKPKRLLTEQNVGIHQLTDLIICQ